MNCLQRWIGGTAARLERILFMWTAALLALLLLSQLVMMNPRARLFLSRVDALEGVPYPGPAD